MNSNNLKQFLIVIFCSMGLYTSGNYIIDIPYIKSLIDALNVMIFFTCLFPFMIVSCSLLSKILKSIYRFIIIGKIIN